MTVDEIVDRYSMRDMEKKIMENKPYLIHVMDSDEVLRMQMQGITASDFDKIKRTARDKASHYLAASDEPGPDAEYVLGILRQIDATCAYIRANRTREKTIADMIRDAPMGDSYLPNGVHVLKSS